MKYSYTVFLVSIVVILAVLATILYSRRAHAPAPESPVGEVTVNSFQTCVDVTGTVMETMPRQCSYEGETYVEFIGNTIEKSDLIVLSNPQPNAEISSPLTIQGEARGYWFFEASFPIQLTNWDGLIIAEGFATAQESWMTEDFVPFTAELTFTTPDYGDNGTLILQKANASGLPENDDALEIPIYFN